MYIFAFVALYIPRFLCMHGEFRRSHQMASMRSRRARRSRGAGRQRRYCAWFIASSLLPCLTLSPVYDLETSRHASQLLRDSVPKQIALRLRESTPLPRVLGQRAPPAPSLRQVEYSRPSHLDASMAWLAGWWWPAGLQLNSIVHNLDLLAGFLLLVSYRPSSGSPGQTYECGKANVGAIGAAEGVAEVAAAARARLALDGEVELVQVLRLEL